MSDGFNGAKYCWMNGSIIKTENALVSAMEPIYLAIFEGIKAYVEKDVMGEGKLNIFRWNSHIDRLWRSAAVNNIDLPYTKELMLQATLKTIEINKFRSNVYIQPRIWQKPRTGSDTPKRCQIIIPVWEFNTILGNNNRIFSRKRRYMISSWRRIASDSLPPQSKSWANYVNSILAYNEAVRCGYDGAIFLDNRGFVSEGTGACLMIVRNNRVITPPITASILESITRDTLITVIEEDHGIPVEVRDITRVELYAADEAFLCGTGYEVTPIMSVDDIVLNGEYPGPITKRMAGYYADILSGKIEKRKKWLTPVMNL